MQSMSIERSVARSVANREQAELAAEAGVNSAINFLSRSMLTNEGVVVFCLGSDGSTTNKTRQISYTMLARVDSSTNVHYLPLFSGANTSLPAVSRGSFPEPSNLLAALPADTATNLPNLPSYLTNQFGGASPNTGWEYIRSASGDVVARFCYWVEDLQGKIDIDIAGNLNGHGQTHSRTNWPPTPDQIALFTIFNPSESSDPGTPVAKEIIDKKGDLPTIKSLLQITNSITDETNSPVDPRAYFTKGLGYEASAPQMIPYGHGYLDEGKPKVALNEAIASPTSSMNVITTAIKNNLPEFADKRRGGMPANDYLNNIAASIIDYADADSLSTTDGVNYRGMDSFPLVNQWFMMSWYKSRTAISATFVVRHFAELWNISDRKVEGVAQLNADSGYIAIVAGSTLNFKNPGSQVTVTHTRPEVTIDLEANEKKVYDFGQSEFRVSTSAYPPDKVFANTTWNASYDLLWKTKVADSFQVVDRSKGGVYGVGKSLNLTPSAPSSKVAWNATIAGLIYKPNINSWGYLNGNVGDPRSSFFINAPQDQNDYDTRAVVGGKTIRSGLVGKTYGSVEPDYWPDPSLGAQNPGNRISSDSKLPTAIVPPANAPDRAPAHLGNYPDSRYRSVIELGNVYDPGQWELYTGTSMADARQAWKDIGDSAEPDNRYGGGYTLRIGRPEFSRFDEEGSRATDLLGIFSADTSISTQGHINVNTASFEVLRALGAGITITNNGFTDPAQILIPHEERQADRFANAVIASRPFYTRHEIASRLQAPVSGTNEFFWGNPRQWLGADQPQAWRDSAAEFLLSRVYDLTTTTSKNFRIFVTAQAIDPRTGRILATKDTSADVFLSPVRNPSNPVQINKFEPKILTKNQ
jgi:hypothetical protein